MPEQYLIRLLKFLPRKLRKYFQAVIIFIFLIFDNLTFGLMSSKCGYMIFAVGKKKLKK